METAQPQMPSNKNSQMNALANIIPQIMNAVGGGDRRTAALLAKQREQNEVRMQQAQKKSNTKNAMRMILEEKSRTGKVSSQRLMEIAQLTGADGMDLMKTMNAWGQYQQQQRGAKISVHKYMPAQERIAGIPAFDGIPDAGINPSAAIPDIPARPGGMLTKQVYRDEMNPGDIEGKFTADKPISLSAGGKLFSQSGKQLATNPKTSIKHQKTKEIQNYEYGLENPDFKSISTTNYAPVKLTKLYNELDNLPKDDPRRKAYQTRINQLLTGGNPELETILAQRIIDGKLDYNKLSRRGKQKGRVAAIIAQLDPGFDLIKADANIKYKTDSSNLRSIALINGVQPLYTKLIKKANSLNNSNIKLTNKAINFAKLQTGDPKLVAFNNLRDDVIAETERILLGTGVLSDSKYMRALDNLNSAQSPKQMEAAIAQMQFVVEKREQALKEEPYPQDEKPDNKKSVKDMSDQELLEALNAK